MIAQDCPYESVFRAHLLPFAVFSDADLQSLCVPINPPAPSPTKAPSNGNNLVLDANPVTVAAVGGLSLLCAVLLVALCTTRRKLHALEQQLHGGHAAAPLGGNAYPSAIYSPVSS